jgi:AraC family ethanolamine operon transcriptional activator
METAGNGVPRPRASTAYSTVRSTDPIDLTEQLRDWCFDFAQLKSGAFNADAAIVNLDGVYVARLATDQTLLQEGFSPPNTISMFMPAAGSSPVFAQAQLLEAGQCVTMCPGASLEAVTHTNFIDIGVGFDLQACAKTLEWMGNGFGGVLTGTAIAAPGQAWIDDMLYRVNWILSAAVEQPEGLNNPEVRASLADLLLGAMVTFDGSPADIDSTTRAERASRRAAVQLARDYIHSRLSEPLRLSELCRHTGFKVRSLEYGFQEVTGLTPIAYVRSLRLNTVRRSLLNDANQRRSISEIAMDAGFWHLSQFSVDYRAFFGETPTQTRRRSLAGTAAISV